MEIQQKMNEFITKNWVVEIISIKREAVKFVKKYFHGKKNFDKIREEIADVEIRITQLKVMFGDCKSEKDKKVFMSSLYSAR